MSFLKHPEKKWKYVYLGQEQDDEEGHWVTIRGHHVFIKDAEDKEQKESMIDSLNHLISYKNMLRNMAPSKEKDQEEKNVANTIERLMKHINLDRGTRDRIRRIIGEK